MRELGAKLGKVRWWVAGALVGVAVLAGLSFAMPAAAAPGDTGDPTGLVLNYGSIRYDGKTYNNKYDQYLSGDIFSPAGTPTCSDSAHGGKSIPQHFLRVVYGGTGGGLPSSAEVYNTTISTSGTNVTSCVANLSKSIALSGANNIKILFFRDGDIIKAYTGSGGQFTKKPQAYDGASELFVNGTGACADAIVSKGGQWYFFPMSAKGAFGLNDNVISEQYAKFVNDPLANNACRVNSLEVATGNTYALTAVPQAIVTIDNGFESNECENWTGTPGMVDLNGVATGGAPPHDWDPSSFNPEIPRWVTKCEIKDVGWEADDSVYTYFVTVQGDDKNNGNALIKYDESLLKAAFFDDGYQLVAGVSTQVPNTLPGNPIPPTGPQNPGGATTYVCEDDSGGLAHVLCPLVRGFDSLMHWAFKEYIMPLLTIPPLTTIPGLQQAWSNVLIIANILFIVVFFIIIFSQATSIGVSNYGIKRMLPRLIAVAILANISYYLCVFAVDFSNILASGISSLILLPLQGLSTPTIQFTGGFGGVLQSVGAVAIIAAFVGAQGGLIAAAAALALPLVLLIALTVLALILRLVVIVGFVVFSPVVFIGFILPGTQRMAGRAVMGFLNLLWAGAIVAAMVSLGGFVVYIIDISLP